jgi:hypothetical protein
LTLNMLPGVMIAQGRMYGTRARRTRALIEDGTDDAVLIVGLGGPHLIEQRGREILLGEGEAVLLSGSSPASFAHGPPGEMLGLRFPRAPFAQHLLRADDSFMARIPSSTRALRFLTSYVDLAWEGRMNAGPELPRLMAAHIFDLMAVMLGATRDTA